MVTALTFLGVCVDSPSLGAKGDPLTVRKMGVLEPVSDRTIRYRRAFQPVVCTPPAIEKRTVCSSAGHFGRSVARQAAALKKNKSKFRLGAPVEKAYDPYPPPPTVKLKTQKRDPFRVCNFLLQRGNRTFLQS
jgi:hypothetical protein